MGETTPAPVSGQVGNLPCKRDQSVDKKQPLKRKLLRGAVSATRNDMLITLSFPQQETVV